MSKNIRWMYTRLYYEFFEILLPHMIYEGDEEEKESFMSTLWNDGKELIYALFHKLCQENNMLYSIKDFEIKAFKKGGVSVVQIMMPQQCDTNVSTLLRAYFLFSEHKREMDYIKCFTIRQFESGQVFIAYITPEIKCLLGEEITKHCGDMEYEIWRVMNTYMMLVAQDMKKRE